MNEKLKYIEELLIILSTIDDDRDDEYDNLDDTQVTYFVLSNYDYMLVTDPSEPCLTYRCYEFPYIKLAKRAQHVTQVDLSGISQSAICHLLQEFLGDEDKIIAFLEKLIYKQI